jgi:hypothetical protein
MEGGTEHDLRALDAVVSSNDEDISNKDDNKRKREGSTSDDGVVSDVSIGNAESKDNNEVKSSSQDNEPEAGEVPDAPRSLHRTSSIFFRHLAMQTTKDDLENVEDFFRNFE